MPARKISKMFLQNVEIPSEKPMLYFDTELKGFGVKVRPSGRITYIVDKRVSGRMKRISLGIYPSVMPDIARKEAFRVLSDIAQGKKAVDREYSSYTIKDLMKEFSVVYKKEVGKTITEGTYKLFINTLKNFDSIITKRVQRLEVEDIDVFKSSLLSNGVSNRFVNINLVTLRKMLGYAIDKGYVESVPKINSLSETKKSREVERLTKEQVKELLSLTDNENILFYIKVMINLGLRPQEMLGLKWEYINLKEGFLTIYSDNKLKKGRTIAIPEVLVGLLNKRMQSSGYVSPYRSTSGARKVLERLGDKIDVKLTPYVLRKTFGSLMAESGVSPFKLAEIMGHSKIETTNKYYVGIRAVQLRKEMNLVGI